MFPFANPRSTAAPAAAGLRPQDVFATSLYTGNGGTQTITNGLDLAGMGGLVWSKQRDAARNHGLFDTARGATRMISTSLSDAESVEPQSLTAFTSSGFTVGADDISATVNFSPGSSRVAWSFRRAPKFFDIVTYTGNGVSGRQIPHGLGVTPGMVIVKCRSNDTNWPVWHRSSGNLLLNGTGTDAGGLTDITSVSTTTFTVASSNGANRSGYTYVAYLFAHDPDPSGIIQCGSFTEITGPVANLGWQPQFAIFKTKDTTDNWRIMDSTRGATATYNPGLRPNTSDAEVSNNVPFEFTSTGITEGATEFGGGTPWVYLAIRAPIT